MAINDAPNIVSGLVVKTFNLFSDLLSFILNIISQPVDLPIQFFCINLTFSGQLFNSLNEVSRSSEKLVILKNH